MDSAFKPRPYPGFTIHQLRAAIAEGRDVSGKMAAEIERREGVMGGDMTHATAGERLRYVQVNRP